MKKTGLQIAAVFMALIVLVSTTSFAVIEHYCSGKLVDTSLFSSSEACEDQPEIFQEGACCEVVVKDCCNDIVYIADGFAELIYSSVQLPELEKPEFYTSAFNFYNNCFNELQKQFIPFKEYVPPNLVFETHVMNQVFRI